MNQIKYLLYIGRLVERYHGNNKFQLYNENSFQKDMVLYQQHPNTCMSWQLTHNQKLNSYPPNIHQDHHQLYNTNKKILSILQHHYILKNTPWLNHLVSHHTLLNRTQSFDNRIQTAYMLNYIYHLQLYYIDKDLTQYRTQCYIYQVLLQLYIVIL